MTLDDPAEGAPSSDTLPAARPPSAHQIAASALVDALRRAGHGKGR
jgi:hypothetical protein